MHLHNQVTTGCVYGEKEAKFQTSNDYRQVVGLHVIFMKRQYILYVIPYFFQELKLDAHDQKQPYFKIHKPILTFY